jgi:pyruvate formate lyase activating enzyme
MEMIREKKRVTGIVFEIERFAIHDGPGIRTLVFMKGCGLRCKWCSNPESQKGPLQLGYNVKKCLRCGRCVDACERDALFLEAGGVLIERSICTLCGNCSEVCTAQALVVFGKEMSPEEVLEEVLKDEIFYRKSKGGVTFSGGDPFEQKDFLVATAKLCKERYLHTAVETCGSVPWESIEETLPYIDLFLYDLKEMDPERHRRFTGVVNEVVLNNYKRLAETGKKIIARVPVIPGFNDRDDNFDMMIDFLNEHTPCIRVSLLPYHRLGKTKYDRLGMEYQLEGIEPPPESRMMELKKKFTQAGFKVSIGG